MTGLSIVLGSDDRAENETYMPDCGLIACGAHFANLRGCVVSLGQIEPA